MSTQLENVILNQRIEKTTLLAKDLIERDLHSSLLGGLESSLIKVITGPRRAGKSSLALQCLKGINYGYLNFEDNALPKEIDSDQLVMALDKIYDRPRTFFFDEIQILPRWEQFLNVLHRRGRNIVVTGSDSSMLSGELASTLTGRHIALELLPLSFREFLKSPHHRLIDDSEQSKIKIFDKYWQRGGFPEVALGSEQPKSYLSALVDSIILRDIVQRFKIRNPQVVSSFLGLMIEEPAARFSASNLHKSLPEPTLSVTSILKYFTMAKDAYLFFELQPFFAKPRLRMKADRKLYLVDHALAQTRNVGISEKHGAILENMIFIELVRRGYIPNDKLFYFQTPRGREIDFLVRHSNQETELIQVSYELQALKTLKRELDALAEAARITGAKKLSIVTYSESRKISHENVEINVVPAHRWLLED